MASCVSLYALRAELPAGKMRLTPLVGHVFIRPGDVEFLTGVHGGPPSQPALFCPSSPQERDSKVGVDRVALRTGAHDRLVHDSISQGYRPRWTPHGVGTELGRLRRLHPDCDLVCVVASVACRLCSCSRQTGAEHPEVTTGTLHLHIAIAIHHNHANLSLSVIRCEATNSHVFEPSWQPCNYLALLLHAHHGSETT